MSEAPPAGQTRHDITDDGDGEEDDADEGLNLHPISNSSYCIEKG